MYPHRASDLIALVEEPAHRSTEDGRQVYELACVTAASALGLVQSLEGHCANVAIEARRGGWRMSCCPRATRDFRHAGLNSSGHRQFMMATG